MNDTGRKLKMLYLKEFFEQRTDENHSVTIKEIQKYLDSKDIPADRRTLYQDIEALQFYGLDIAHEPYEHGYNLVSRDFEVYELKLMIDAIASSRFLSEKRSRVLIDKLKGLCSHYDAQPLQRQVLLANRVKGVSKVLHINVDIISEAIYENRQIQFRYFKYNTRKERQFNKREYIISPWAMLYADDQYYLLAYDAAEKKQDKAFKYFRLDRITDIAILPDPRDGKDQYERIDLAVRTKSTFNMFGGKIQNVTLRFPNFQFEIALDKFGRDIVPMKDGDEHFTITVPVAVGPHFYGWVFGLKNYVTIVGPEDVRKGMIDMLEAVKKRYI